MANVKVTETAGLSNPEIAKKLYKAGFAALDATRRGDATVTVSANVIIDLMIAYEAAIEGDTADLEWALAVQAATTKGAVAILDKARQRCWSVGDFDSKEAELYSTDPYSAFLKEGGEKAVREAGKAAFLAITK